jgi:hypothetical protein
MTAIMSFSSAPDAGTLGRVAGALAVDEAFVEKDWFVVQAIRLLIGLGTDDIQPIFSGGTSLLKAHNLICRFSEDIDFKLALSEAFIARSQSARRSSLSRFKKRAVGAWTEAGFMNVEVEAGSGNAYIKIEMDYPTVFAGHEALRPHILAEISAKPPRLPAIDRPVASFVAQFSGAPPEVASLPCVDPVETAADKVSAFAWRALARDRNSEKDDPTIVRHLHDLAVLEASVIASAAFPTLLLDALVSDSARGGGFLAELPPRTRLARMQGIVSADPLYPKEYSQFVEGMAFAGAGDVPGYDQAFDALTRLCKLLP